jgi:anti-sigma28 factor (negative regulator of flagellin synthesis)
MRITEQNTQVSTTSTQPQRVAGAQATGSSGESKSVSQVSSGGDQAEFSGFLSRLSQNLQSDTAGRAQRVSQLAAAVQSGSYKVDSASLSRTLVDQAIAAGSAGQ